MKRLLRFLRPMRILRRKAVLGGLLGGDRKWLVWGGAAWVFHWLGRIFGGGEAKPRYTQTIGPGERVVVVHEPLSPLQKKKAAKKEIKQARKAAKKA